MKPDTNFPIIILAAGNSSRLGRPKQSLLFGEKSLLQHTAVEALKVSSNVIVVTGADTPTVLQELAGLSVITLENVNWQEGMSTSIRKGIEFVSGPGSVADFAIIAVCDQPYISGQVFTMLELEQRQTGKGIIASRYGDTIGTPVLFSRKYFEDLKNLEGQQGAKKLLDRFMEDVATIPFANGEVDIDTEEDYQKLPRGIQD